MTARTAARETTPRRNRTKKTTTRRTKRTTRTAKTRAPKPGHAFAVPVSGRRVMPSAWYFGW